MKGERMRGILTLSSDQICALHLRCADKIALKSLLQSPAAGPRADPNIVCAFINVKGGEAKQGFTIGSDVWTHTDLYV